MAAPAGVAQAQTALPPGEDERAHPHTAQGAATRVLFFFNDEEARFVEAAIDRLIPPDGQTTGAAGAGVLHYIDGQLASSFGAGGRMYLRGPWRPDAPPQQGYQLRFTPAELYRIGIEEVREAVRSAHGGREFWDLAQPVQDDVLKSLETGALSLPSLPSPVFFETRLANTIEGFFADPAYLGNRDMAGWRMIGFPGAYAQYVDLVDQYGLEYRREPIGIADQHARAAHLAGHHGHE
jgi:gluconate 2-dehydrogenase gamma chain